MLRGSLNDLPRFLQTTRRELQNNPVESTSSDGSGSNAFLWFASVVVGLICCCYIYCMYQVIRFWCCRRPNPLEISQTVLVHEGYVFNLNPRQRRAVLEAIFSETSKVRLFILKLKVSSVVGYTIVPFENNISKYHQTLAINIMILKNGKSRLF